MSVESIKSTEGTGNWTGALITTEHPETFWMFTCPCDVTDSFPMNGLPEVDTPQSCGNPDHWAVKFNPPRPRNELVEEIEAALDAQGMLGV